MGRREGQSVRVSVLNNEKFSCKEVEEEITEGGREGGRKGDLWDGGG
jgi:hypothetical protein